MKKISISILLTIICLSTQAGDFDFAVKKSPSKIKSSSFNGGSSLEQGNIIFSAGYGIPNWTYFRTSDKVTYINYSGSGMGPLHGKVEFMVHEKIGLGVSVNHVQTNYSYKQPDGLGHTYFYKLNYHSTAINFRSNFYIYAQKGFNVYAGLGIGYAKTRIDFETDDPLALSFGFGLIPIGTELTLGFRYFVVDQFGFYLETGYAKSLIQAGVCVKL